MMEKGTATPDDRGSTLLRPAVSPRRPGESLPAAALDHPLGPFRRLLRDLYEAEPMAALVSSHPEDEDEEEWPEPPPLATRESDLDLIDLASNEEPWIDPALSTGAGETSRAPIELPDFLIESGDAIAGGDAFWLDFDAMESAATEPLSPDASELQEVPELRDAELSLDAEARELTTVGEADLPDSDAGAAPPQRPADGDSRPEVMDEVAGRLERIARSLRDRNTADLLGGSDDPLQVLIAGYVLGLSAAARAAGGRGEERS